MEVQTVAVNNFQVISKLSTCIVTLVIFFFSVIAYAENYTGTYTNLEYHQESGDLLGIEMRVVFTRKGYQASLQIAEGGISELIIVKLNLKKQALNFEIDSPALYKGIFNGVITEDNLKGLLKYSSGGELEFNLPRRKSYWD